MLSTHPGVRWFIMSWFFTTLRGQNLYFCENEDPCVAANEKTPYEPEARFSNCGISNTLCDRYIRPGWYRYSDRMLDHCPSLGSCGSIYPTWLNGSHPIGVNSEIERIVCKVGFSGCCERHYKIKIRNCGLYMAYCLPALDTCPERYCFGETGSCVFTNSFSTTEAITERTPTTSQSTMEQTTESTPKTDLSTTQTITEPKPTTSQSRAESITERTPTTNMSTTETITEHKPTTSQSTTESITEPTPTTNLSTREPITERTLITRQSPTEPITERTPTTNLSTREPITEPTPTTSQSPTEPIIERTPTTNLSTREPITEPTPTTRVYTIENTFSFIKKMTLLNTHHKSHTFLGESSLGVMPVVAIVTVACVMLVAVISATIYKIRQTDRRLDRQREANRKAHLSFHLRHREPQTEENEYQEIESVTENDSSSIQDGGYASMEPATSTDDSEENVYENEISYRDHHHPTPCGNNGVHNPTSIGPVYDSII